MANPIPSFPVLDSSSSLTNDSSSPPSTARPHESSFRSNSATLANNNSNTSAGLGGCSDPTCQDHSSKSTKFEDFNPLTKLKAVLLPSSPQSDRTGRDFVISMDSEKVPPFATRQMSVGERLQPTILVATAEKIKYEAIAKATGYALNIAIGLQVVLGALTTSVAAVTSGRTTTIATCVLGGFATTVASYLARARGSNEPELSIARVKDLDMFLRECASFQMDHGHVLTGEFDVQVAGFREKFEQLLGNGNGERRLAPS